MTNSRKLGAVAVWAMVVAGCGAQEVAPAGGAEGTGSEAALREGCTDCDALVGACMNPGCLEKAYGDPATYWYIWNPCVDACVNDVYRPCIQARDAIQPQWSYVGPTMSICHIDPDTHIGSVDVELYTVDRYEDLSCRSPYGDVSPSYGYRKRLVTTVHVSCWTPSECKRKVPPRVTERLQQLVQQGYTLLTAEQDRDACPVPRVP
jgi:hypothetical protein